MKHTMKRMITAMLAIAMVFSAFAIILPGAAEAAPVDSEGTIMFNVIGADGKYINGATWILKDGDGETLATGTTSLSGLGVANNIPLFGTCYLTVANNSVYIQEDIELDPETGEFEFKVISFGSGADTGAYGYLSEQVPGTTVTFVNATLIPMPATVLGNSFYIEDASLVSGDVYTVIIRVPGYDAMMANVTYNTGADFVLGDNLTAGNLSLADGNGRALVAQLDARETKNSEVQTVVFGADYNSFDWIRVTNNSFDVEFPNLGSNIPIRMQIDTSADGVVDAAEETAFLTNISNYMVLTGSFLRVNGTAYQSNGTFQASASGLQGSVYSTDRYEITYEQDYISNTAIDATSSIYSASLNVKYDTPDLNRSYIIDLPDNFELNSQLVKTQYVEVSSADYNNFTVHPLTYDGSNETVGMTFNTYGVPSASGAIDASDYAYAYSVDGVLQHYIVGKNQAVTFNASSSTDANGNPLDRFVWDFGDGNDTNVSSATVQHAYSTASGSGYTVTLHVINHNDSMSEETSFTVLVDDVDPTATIDVVTANPTAGSAASFSGLNSTDDVAAAGDGLGIIAKWIWNFGDGSANVTKTSDNGNVSKTFTSMGTYNVTLTVVDVAGNSDSVTQQVQVLRAAMPALSIQSVTFSPDTFEEGVAGTITVVVKNNGDWTANEFTVNLYKVVGTETELLTSELFTTPLAPGENTTVNISYTFGAQGDYRLKVTVQDDDPRSSDSNDFSSLSVSEAGWKNIAIFVGVIVVIGVIVALVYYRNRLPGRDSFRRGGSKEAMAPLKQEKVPSKEEPARVEEPKRKAPASGKKKR